MLQTEKLIKFVRDTGYSQLPSRLIEHARLCLLDTIGCTVAAGSQSETGTLQPVHTMTWNTCREATRIGRRAKASASDAFRVNAYASSCLDFDRGKSFQYMHPGRLLILSALAAGEKLNVSYKELITAIILGYEVLLRVGRAVRPIGWPLDELHPDTKFSPYCFSLPGTAGIVLKLLDMNTNGETNIGTRPISQASGNHTQKSSEGSANTILADNKVTRLISSMVSLLTETCDSNTPLSVPVDEERISTITAKLGNSTELTARLEQKYLITEVGFIPTSQCYYVQSPIMAVKKALRGEYMDMDRIRWIDLIGLQWLAAIKNKHTEDVAGRMATATALLINNVNPEVAWYLNGELENTTVRVLASKIRFFDDLNSWMDLIESRDYLFRAVIETTDGRRRLEIVKHEIKGIDDVTTENQFKTRFSDYTSYTLGDEKAQKLQKALLEQDDIGVRDLMKLVQPKFWSFF